MSDIHITVYAPKDKHALDRHGVEKVLLVENTVGRNINGRRGGGSLSVLDVLDANRRAGSRGVGISHGIGSEFITHGSSSGRGLSGSSVGGRVSVSRGSQAGFSRALSDDDSISNCHYGCGDDKLCRSGHKCVHDGCSSYCVDISSRSSSSGLTRVSSNDGHISSGSRIGTSGLARNFDLSRSSRLETIDSGLGVSGHSGSDILDAISSGRVGLDNVDSRRSGSGRTSGSGVVFQSVLGGKTDCKKDCFSDGDCPTSKYCATVNCHMICRRRPSKGYSP
ncbi:Hypothetical predicted protein [Mytilus galloprovincialis]|uniref:WAP domain-containing protein n=1 Tax=Mytilus galloprovincialis TaxID=29158 RepID=A0A8B6E541_MYTGA|nr:Hypothetical predicted protein [Mytilus galloprovincialis]